MRTRVLVGLAAALFVTSAAQSQTASIDKPWPSDFSKRLYINPEDLGGVRDRMERIVGYWGVRKGNVVTVSGDQPASFAVGNPSVTNVKLKELTPVYNSVITSGESLEAGIPVMSISLAQDERAQVKVTELAQFESSRLPTSADWAAVRESVESPNDVVFISAVVVTSVETTRLSQKRAGGGGIIQILNLGGKTYQSTEDSTSTLVVSVTATRPLSAITAPATRPGVRVAGRIIIKPEVASFGISDLGIAAIAQ
jgi:hypothetical protein